MTALRRIVVTVRAAGEIAAADVWWAAHRPAAPGATRDEVERAFALLSIHPGIGAAAVGPRVLGVRRIHLSRIRYHLYYRASGDLIEVLAFWHSSRGAPPTL